MSFEMSLSAELLPLNEKPTDVNLSESSFSGSTMSGEMNSPIELLPTVEMSTDNNAPANTPPTMRLSDVQGLHIGLSSMEMSPESDLICELPLNDKTLAERNLPAELPPCAEIESEQNNSEEILPTIDISTEKLAPIDSLPMLEMLAEINLPLDSTLSSEKLSPPESPPAADVSTVTNIPVEIPLNMETLRDTQLSSPEVNETVTPSATSESSTVKGCTLFDAEEQSRVAQIFQRTSSGKKHIHFCFHGQCI